MTKLIYIADPMCSWCYGFGPELVPLLDGVPEISLDIVVGGLRAYNTDTMNDDTRASMLVHWDHVKESSGLPFTDKAISTDNFIYDTEPACRAVVTVRTLAPQATLSAFRKLQHAFYAEGLDITKADILAEICVDTLNKNGISIDKQAFLNTWSSEEIIASTHADFVHTQKWGITGFPSLVMEIGGQLHLVTSGFARTEDVIAKMQDLVDQKA